MYNWGMTERCFESQAGIINHTKDIELSREQCEAIHASCKAWETLILEADQIITTSPKYVELRRKMSISIREAVGKLDVNDKKFLFSPDANDPFGRSIFDQALDARMLELEKSFGGKRPSILDYTSDRDYWLRYKELADKQKTLN